MDWRRRGRDWQEEGRPPARRHRPSREVKALLLKRCGRLLRFSWHALLSAREPHSTVSPNFDPPPVSVLPSMLVMHTSVAARLPLCPEPSRPALDPLFAARPSIGPRPAKRG